MWLFAAFLLVPVIEIGLFIQVGGLIGLWPTLGLVLLTAVVGTAVMRTQGARALADLQRAMNELRDPTAPLAHGAMILFAGALLLTPGFFTDAMGLVLLVPQLREALLRRLARHMQTVSFTMGASRRPAPRGDDVIEGDFIEIDPEKRPPQGPSGWTQH